MDDLKHQVMINQFVLAAGCLSHEAKSYLKSSHWQFEAALSSYFGESGIPHQHNQHPNRPPANTPATPPAFPETLLSFAKMNTNEGSFQTMNPSNASGAQKCKLVRPDPSNTGKKTAFTTLSPNNNRS